MMPVDVLTMRLPTLLITAGLALGPVPPLVQRTGARPAPAAVVPLLPPSAPAAPVQATGDDDVPTDPIIALLDAIERRGREITAFESSLFYETEEGFLGQATQRLGHLLYAVEPDGDKAFAVQFDTIIENRRRRERENQYIYRDGWLVEIKIDRQQKQFIKRQIVGLGKTFDPLKLGEGPFPLPIGQARDEVLRLFEVTTVSLPESGPLAKLRDRGPLDGLRLVPLAGTPNAENVGHVDLFYDRADRLPVGIELIEINGDRKTVRLSDVVVNPVLDATSLERLDITEPDPGSWFIDIRPLEGGS